MNNHLIKYIAYIPAIALSLVGCQNLSIDYLNNPSTTSPLKRELAQTQLCLDAKFSRTASLTCDRIQDSASRILPDIANLASRVPAIVGVDPTSGRYFGNQVHSPLPGVQTNYSGESTNKARALVLHPLNAVVTTLEAVSQLSGDTLETTAQTGNLLLQPLNANSSRRDSWLADSKNANSKEDGAKLAYDNTTSVVTGPIKTFGYVLTSGSTPDTVKHGVDNARQWAGYSVDKERAEELNQKFANPNNPNSQDNVRLGANAIPFVDKPLDEVGWGTTQRRNFGDTVATTIPQSIPSSQSSDWAWGRQLRGQEYNAPGVIQTNKEGNPEFHPNESKILAFLRFGKIFSFFHGNKGSSATTPQSGGGTTGWPTGK